MQAGTVYKDFPHRVWAKKGVKKNPMHSRLMGELSSAFKNGVLFNFKRTIVNRKRIDGQPFDVLDIEVLG